MAMPNGQAGLMPPVPPFASPGQFALVDYPRFEELCRNREIHPAVAQDLLNVLCTTDVVILCDDSGSMRSAISEDSVGVFVQKKSTRWLELQKLVAMIVEFVTAIQPQGCEVRFLNRQGLGGVTQVAQLEGVFQALPSDRTPLLTRLSEIFQTERVAEGRYLLVIVISDGEPTDGSHRQLFDLLMSKPSYCHVSLAECTDIEEDMDWLDQFDGRIPNYDNNDDYRAELARVRQAMGPDFPFGIAHYICKIILASFLRWWFMLDQSRVGTAVPVWYAPRGQSAMASVVPQGYGPGQGSAPTYGGYPVQNVPQQPGYGPVQAPGPSIIGVFPQENEGGEGAEGNQDDNNCCVIQ